jgi:bifunctional non-homologous end joining protein LigD
MAASPFTIEAPDPLPVERDGNAWRLAIDGHDLRLTNLDKVFWPDEGYTKGDLLSYYFSVASMIVPHLVDRPLTMKRMPNGITGEFFYEKTAPSHSPDWMGRCRIASEDAKGGVIDYLTIADTAGLLFVANLGCIEFHPLHARCATIGTPDYLFFDLDPAEDATFGQVLTVARHVKTALDGLGLAGYPKTSGATGIQIFVPIEPRYPFSQVRDLVGRIGRLIVAADPDNATMEPRIARRTGRVFIDHNMNRSGANIAAAYSVRPEPEATVSTPLRWAEIEAGVTPRDFRIATVFERFDRVGDLFDGVLHAPQDLDGALEALEVPTPEPKGGRRTASRSDSVIAASRDPDLRQYLVKRDFEGTPEPTPGAVVEPSGDSFVIHKHRATRLHYDLRLESDGALPSWAIPRGLPLVPGEKRMAVRTEDHPIEYGAFEGVIPKGNYGAGRVWIFDRGTFERLEWTDKKVSFRLHGERYRGLEWHLVRTTDGWLVFLANHQDVPVMEAPPSLSPMLAEGGFEPFDDEGWRFEPKLDGMRAVVTTTTDSTRLVSRTGRDVSAGYPELHALHETVLSANAVLDGEIIATDERGRNSFEALQQRMNLSNPKEIERASRQAPVAFVAFDILFYDGEDTTTFPLEDRRLLLEHVVEENDRIRVNPYIDGAGVAFTAQAETLELEGVVAKRLGSRYRPGRRSDDWRKIKLRTTQDCVILGWTPGQGDRSDTFGALLVGAFDPDDGELRWVGQVGSGFSDRVLVDLLARLDPLQRTDPPAADPDLAAVRGAVFVEPGVVCEVEYQEMTGAGKMRAPSFKGLRPDVSVAACILGR